MVNPNKWDNICSQIAQELFEVRNEWFQSCLKTAKCADAYGSKSKIVNYELDTNISQSMNAFMLLQVQDILSKKQYISPEQGRDFVSMLYDYVCGDNIDKCIEYLHNYDEVREDIGTQFYRIASDIVKGITHENDPAIAMGIVPFLPSWGLISKMTVSKIFNDEDTTDQLEQQRKQYMKKITEDADNMKKN